MYWMQQFRTWSLNVCTFKWEESSVPNFSYMAAGDMSSDREWYSKVFADENYSDFSKTLMKAQQPNDTQKQIIGLLILPNKYV